MESIALTRTYGHSPYSASYTSNQFALHHRDLDGKYGRDERQVDNLLAARVVEHRRAEVGEVQLGNYMNIRWVGQMTLGDSNATIVFDTGSFDLIVNHGAYTPSKGAKKTGKPFSIEYASKRSASGKVYLDKFAVGGLRGDAVGIGRSHSDSLNLPHADGIAGMGMGTGRTGQATFLDRLVEEGALEENVFTFEIDADGPSSLHLGGVPHKYKDRLTYVNVDASKGYWGVPGTLNGINMVGILDTATTYMNAPIEFAKELFKRLGLDTTEQDGTLYALYTDEQTPPTLSFTFGSLSIQIPPASLSRGKADDGRNVLAITGRDVGNLTQLVLGDVFLRQVVAVFSRKEHDKPQVGLIARHN